MTISVWVVAIVIQGILVTEVGPFAWQGSCRGQMKSIVADIETSFNTTPSYDGTKWGLTDTVVWEDYEIDCVQRQVEVNQEVKD